MIFKVWILTVFLLTPVKFVQDLHVHLDTGNHGIFREYSNLNFVQTFTPVSGGVEVSSTAISIFDLDLNYILTFDRSSYGHMSEPVKKIFDRLFDRKLEYFLKNIADYLKKIRYREDADINSRNVAESMEANCIGYANLIRELLSAGSVKCEHVRGFYLQRRDGSFIPQPHRWVEISVGDRGSFFFDPQRQKFSSDYILVKRAVNFRETRKFSVKLIDENKKLLD